VYSPLCVCVCVLCTLVCVCVSCVLSFVCVCPLLCGLEIGRELMRAVENVVAEVPVGPLYDSGRALCVCVCV